VIFSLAAVPNASTRGDPSIHFQCYFSHGPLTFLTLHVCVYIASVKNLYQVSHHSDEVKKEKNQNFSVKNDRTTPEGYAGFLPVIPRYASTLHLFVQIRADLFLKISWTDLRAGLTCAWKHAETCNRAAAASVTHQITYFISLYCKQH